MALITCRECGKEISDKAAACIHCGCPVEIAMQSDFDITSEKTKNTEPAEVEIIHIKRDKRELNGIKASAIILGLASLPVLIMSAIEPFEGASFLIGIILIANIILFLMWYNYHLDYTNTSLILTNKRILGKQGAIIKRELQSPLSKINSIRVERNTVNHKRGTGNIIISVQFGDLGEYNFKNMSSVNEFADLAMKEIDKH